MSSPTPLLTDTNTHASHPGRTKLSLWTALRHQVDLPKTLVGYIFPIALLGFWLHWAFYLLVVPGALLVALRLRVLHEQFWYGCAAPGLIVSTSPLRYAVLTDLRRWAPDRFPAIKIVERRAFRPVLGGSPAEVGTRIMTIAFYTQGLGAEGDRLPHWVDFDPVPADCGTRDRRAIERLFGTATESDWRELEEALTQVPAPCVPGLYPVDRETTTWAITQSEALLESRPPG